MAFLYRNSNDLTQGLIKGILSTTPEMYTYTNPSFIENPVVFFFTFFFVSACNVGKKVQLVVADEPSNNATTTIIIPGEIDTRPFKNPNDPQFCYDSEMY